MPNDIANKLLLSAEENVKVAQDMLKLGHYSWALFMWHLSIEKIIKAIIAKKNIEIPYIHNLQKLATVAGLNFSSINVGQLELDEITSFNLEARYDDYKLAFYKKATPEYTAKWTEICTKVYNHIKKELI